MNILIFDHQDRLISLQASHEWVRDFFCHPTILLPPRNPLDESLTQQRYIESSLAAHLGDGQTNSHLYISLQDKSALASIPLERLGYPPELEGLALIDFQHKKLIYNNTHYPLDITKKELLDLDPSDTASKERLSNIHRLLQKKFLTPTPQLLGEDLNTILKSFKNLVKNKLKENKGNETNTYTIEHPDADFYSLSLHTENVSWEFIQTNTWNTSFFVEKAIEVCLLNDFILTQDQEAAWHRPGVLSEDLFEPLHIAREKSMLTGHTLVHPPLPSESQPSAHQRYKI